MRAQTANPNLSTHASKCNARASMMATQDDHSRPPICTWDGLYVVWLA